MSQSSNPPTLVPALFADRQHAEAAVADLRRFGIAENDIGIAVADPGRYQHRDPSDREVVGAVGRGAATGAPLGSIAGMALAGLTLGEVVALGVGGLLVAGTGGLIWGGVIGGLVGVITRVRRRPEEDRWCEVELGGDDVLVVVRVRDWSHEDRIAAVLNQAGARAVLDRLALDKDWHDLELEHPSGKPAPDGHPT
ncbi:MAG: hypothetical protein JO352_05680 [Chloroflexi bacterium]|nr:hypothetical protein [Chloroflexota bacterium]MBV9596598.1 hypothetical protein [Chloroflexota bacterium]